jgi:hypothetical protein
MEKMYVVPAHLVETGSMKKYVKYLKVLDPRDLHLYTDISPEAQAKAVFPDITEEELDSTKHPRQHVYYLVDTFKKLYNVDLEGELVCYWEDREGGVPSVSGDVRAITRAAELALEMYINTDFSQ